MGWIKDQIQDTHKWRRLNGWLVIFWAAMFPISIVFNLMSIVAFISLLSIYANFATHLGVWAGARAEAKAVEVNQADEVDINSAEKVNLPD